MGRGDRLPAPRGAGLLHPECAILANGVSFRWTAFRRGPCNRRTGLPAMCWRAQFVSGVEAGRHVHLVLEHEGNKASLLGGGDQVRCTMGRRCTSLSARPADRRARGLLRRLQGRRGVVGQGAVGGVCLSGPGFSARTYARRTERRFAADGVRILPAEPRSDRQPRDGRPADATCRSRSAARGQRAAAACPQIPMLFMGEEYGSRAPFLYFTDHNDELATLVRDGRRQRVRAFRRVCRSAAARADPRSERARHLRDVHPDPDRRGFRAHARNTAFCSGCGSVTSFRASPARRASAPGRSETPACSRAGRWAMARTSSSRAISAARRCRSMPSMARCYSRAATAMLTRCATGDCPRAAPWPFFRSVRDPCR